ncbi:glycosyl hydrolase family 61 domain-containing protein [Sarocladium implicatum]|nr:glycosyl hydrolase family 61 domain-containing protein [Sarocladium implicatum]
MKSFILTSLALATAVNAHAILQEVSVNGQRQGSLVGLRAPNQNNPVENILSGDITCGKVALTDSNVITVPAGAKVGAWYQHVIGGEQFPGDPDNPIAKSHKGPITAWLTPVDNAASASHSNREWFKVAEENLDTSRNVWGVDTLLAQGGWWYFTLPSCIPSGQYLLRWELLALHSAYTAGGAQFYSSCAQIQVTGGGSFKASQTQTFPGAYQKGDPSIEIMIYGASGGPDNDRKAYQAPGMRAITC